MKRTPLQLVIKLSFFCMDVCCSESKQQRVGNPRRYLRIRGAETQKGPPAKLGGFLELKFWSDLRACPLTSRTGHTARE